jgi:hypothetical protein
MIAAFDQAMATDQLSFRFGVVPELRAVIVPFCNQFRIDVLVNQGLNRPIIELGRRLVQNFTCPYETCLDATIEEIKLCAKPVTHHSQPNFRQLKSVVCQKGSLACHSQVSLCKVEGFSICARRLKYSAGIKNLVTSALDLKRYKLNTHLSDVGIGCWYYTIHKIDQFIGQKDSSLAEFDFATTSIGEGRVLSTESILPLKRFHETLKQKWGQNPVRAKREAGNLASKKRGNASNAAPTQRRARKDTAASQIATHHHAFLFFSNQSNLRRTPHPSGGLHNVA